MEMIVSIGLFTVVLFISSSAFLAVLNADRKSRATRIAIDNLNLSLEDMSRRIKTGTTYNCGGGAGVNDCASGGIVLAINDQDDQRVIYKRGVGTGVIELGNSPSGCGPTFSSSTQGCLIRHITSGTPQLVTGKDIHIANLRFVVNGTDSFPADTAQPYVVVLVEGITTAGKITSAFKLQTTITQRMYDL